MSTPNGVIYQTPINVDEPTPETALTPYNGAENIDTIMSTSPPASPRDDQVTESENASNPIPLMQNGHTQSDLLALFQQAQDYSRSGDASQAEALFQNAIEGFQHLLGPMHNKTNKVIFALTTFYFE